MSFKVTEEEFRQHCDDSDGICLECGEWSSSGEHVEPDAEDYKCGFCGEYKVMGAEMALVGGEIEFYDD
jgi:hypothetical protein